VRVEVILESVPRTHHVLEARRRLLLPEKNLLHTSLARAEGGHIPLGTVSSAGLTEKMNYSKILPMITTVTKSEVDQWPNTLSTLQ
jgi:hypothetical protein